MDFADAAGEVLHGHPDLVDEPLRRFQHRLGVAQLLLQLGPLLPEVLLLHLLHRVFQPDFAGLLIGLLDIQLGKVLEIPAHRHQPLPGRLVQSLQVIGLLNDDLYFRRMGLEGVLDPLHLFPGAFDNAEDLILAVFDHAHGLVHDASDIAGVHHSWSHGLLLGCVT